MLEKRTLTLILVSLAIFLDMMIYCMIIPVLPSYSAILGADRLVIGVIFGIYSVALLLFSIPFGYLSDRIGRRPLMIGGMALLSLTTIIFAMATDISILILARAVQGISAAATWSAGLALLADTFDGMDRGQKLGVAMSMNSLGALSGPFIGGIIYDNFGYSIMFILPAIMAFLAGVSFLGLPAEMKKRESKTITNRFSLSADPALFFVIASISMIGAATFGIFEPYMPIFLHEKFGATPTAIGIIFGVLAFFNMIVQPVAGKLYDRHWGKPMMTSGLIISSIIILAVVSLPSLAASGAMFSLLGLSLGFSFMPMLPLMSDLYGGSNGQSSQGMVYGVYNTLFSIGLAAGPFIGGAIISYTSIEATFYGQALLLAITGVIAFIFIRMPKK